MNGSSPPPIPTPGHRPWTVRRVLRGQRLATVRLVHLQLVPLRSEPRWRPRLLLQRRERHPRDADDFGDGRGLLLARAGDLQLLRPEQHRLVHGIPEGVGVHVRHRGAVHGHSFERGYAGRVVSVKRRILADPAGESARAMIGSTICRFS